MSNRPNPKIAVLFVCLGNICRSPMAEGAFRAAAAKAGLDARVDSVGTAAYHIGDNPDPRAIATARRHGVDISSAIGRQLSEEDFTQFTHIFALDKANLAGIRAREPRRSTAKIALLLEAVDGRQGEAVPDPYYGDDSGFEECWQTISEAIEAVIAQLCEQRGEEQHRSPSPTA
ncbi:low molecular weight protein-tyrosine-phosphatase [uncultured Erythrobacter sp.]|uniref:low molecular weight protein-tyrosine-phosphatase n=1 Tax=uncultured Erythrobacter sp. TaxID=263913 RepID=UPI00262529FA|nr:low molecular weight protein-tyrosine-phosphatase [uncultured Erythrobacter sp.]